MSKCSAWSAIAVRSAALTVMVQKEVADRLIRAVPEQAVIGRWGGEEFILLFERISLADAQIVAERVRAALADKPVRFESLTIPISASIGVAINHTLDTHVIDTLLGAADTALYHAKHMGRNRVEIAGG